MERRGLIFTIPKRKKTKRNSTNTEQKQAEQTRPKSAPKYNKINILKKGDETGENLHKHAVKRYNIKE